MPRTQPTFDVYSVLEKLHNLHAEANEAETRAHATWVRMQENNAPDVELFFDSYIRVADYTRGVWDAYKSVYDAIDANLAWQEHLDPSPQRLT